MINSENGLLVVSVLLNVRDRDIGGFVNEAKSQPSCGRSAFRRVITWDGAASMKISSTRGGAWK